MLRRSILEIILTGSPVSISVVMPLFNKRPYVRRAVESVLGQHHRSLELLVIDDGSSDGGGETLADIEDPRLRIIRRDNAGVAHARNHGISLAISDWVALLDADDVWASDHLDEIVGMAAAFPEAGLVATRIEQIWVTADITAAPSASVAVRPIDYFTAAIADGHVVTSSSAALRRAVALEIGGFRDLRPGEDIDCWVRIALGWPVIASTRRTAFYQRGTGGSMDGWAARTGRWEIRSREGFGGTVATIEAALASGRHEDRRATLEAYADQRILSNAGNSLSVGDARGAAQRLALLHRRAGRRYWIYRTLALLPGSVTRAGIVTVRSLRQRLRKRPNR